MTQELFPVPRIPTRKKVEIGLLSARLYVFGASDTMSSNLLRFRRRGYGESGIAPPLPGLSGEDLATRRVSLSWNVASLALSVSAAAGKVGDGPSEVIRAKPLRLSCSS